MCSPMFSNWHLLYWSNMVCRKKNKMGKRILFFSKIWRQLLWYPWSLWLMSLSLWISQWSTYHPPQVWCSAYFGLSRFRSWALIIPTFCWQNYLFTESWWKISPSFHYIYLCMVFIVALCLYQGLWDYLLYVGLLFDWK